MVKDRSLKVIFDQDPELYDEMRPGYPEELIEDILSISKIHQDGRILEIGSGTGQATMPFAKRGYSILCLEIGENLASFATEKFRDYPKVEIKTVSFEEWEPQGEYFDLVISASAFHWIPPEMAYPKVAQVLKDSGCIVVFTHHRPYPYDDFFYKMQKVYKSVVPEWEDPTKGKTSEDTISSTEEYMNNTGLFEKVTVKRYLWSQEYSAEQHLKLLNTYSDHRNLEEEKRQRLFNELREFIKQEYGGKVTRPYLTVLYIAKKRKEE